MTTWTRVRTEISGEIPVSAEAYWNALTDWPAVLEWCPKLPLLRMETKAGHSAGKFPCTRTGYINPAVIPPGIFAPPCVETLLHADPEARVIHYCVEGESVYHFRNYLAFQEVDALGPDRCRTTIATRFDVPAGDEEACKAVIYAIHNVIIYNMAETIVSRSKAAG